RLGDRAQWDLLWQAYLRFYRQRLSAALTDTTFARLIDESSPLCGFVAAQNDKLVGLAHYLFHAYGTSGEARQSPSNSRAALLAKVLSTPWQSMMGEFQREPWGSSSG